MKIIAVSYASYAIEVDEHNVIVVDVNRNFRTGPIWKERMYGLHVWQEPKEPLPSIDELMAYPLYEQFNDPKYADAMKYHEE